MLLMSKAVGLPFLHLRLASEQSLWQKRSRTFLLVTKSTKSTPFSSFAPEQKKEKVIVISGPTGAGKSRLALDIAKRLNGEIISADSVQVYRGLDVGSAKPSLADQAEVPHHLINLLSPFQEYSAGQFFEDARNATKDVLRRGKVPLVSGGTGLYLRWFIYGKPDVPKSSFEISSQVCTELMHFQEKGRWDEAVEIVANAGEPNAQNISRNNWYRLRRSLEIIKTSGSPPCTFTVPYDSVKEVTCLQQNWSAPISTTLDYDFLCLFLACPRVDLYRAIDLRCEEMLMKTPTLLSEASRLLDIGLRPNMNSATRAIGYRHALEYLLECRQDAGRITSDCFHAFLCEFQKSSRNFAKRQLTWFRNEALYHWIDASKPHETLVDFVCNAYNNKHSEKLMVPKQLQMNKDGNGREASYELKTYRTQNRNFRNESDCRHVLDWVGRTQQG